MTDILVLRDAEAAQRFQHMTYPAHRPLLSFAPDVAPIAICALEDGAPVGLALASLGPAASEAKLVSLFVAEAWRQRGLGTALLRHLELACAARGVEKLSGTYMSGQPATPAVERILATTGWTPPKARMLVARCSLDSIKGARWLNHFRIPDGYELLRWVEVSAAERDEIRASDARNPWIAGDLKPFDHERGIEPVTSLALRVDGKVLGWCLNHLVDDMLRFTCSYGRYDLRRRGRLMLLWSEAVRRMPSIGATIGIWTMPVWHEDMVNFARKHVQPYAIFFGETFGAERLIERHPRDLG
jgi:GNAT superfamily N-acetyltransferase